MCMTSTFAKGEMAEWSIAAVLKTVELRGSGGSNPSLSANPHEERVRQGSFFVHYGGPNLFEDTIGYKKVKSFEAIPRKEIPSHYLTDIYY